MNIKDYQVVVLGIIISLGCVFSTYILSKAVVDFQKIQTQTIRVTGSASQLVTSDSASWTINLKTKRSTLKEGYLKISSDSKAVIKFLINNNFKEEDITLGTINNYENFGRYPNGSMSNEVVGYTVYQSLTVKSDDIEKITKVSKSVDELINQNINLSAENVRYFVSNLDDIKIKMVGEATKNAKQRAESMVKGTNGKIGTMNSAKMGVFQIVPVNSTDVSDYGINDTSSIEKKVVATVNATFNVK